MAQYNDFGPYVDPSMIEYYIYDNDDNSDLTNIDTSNAWTKSICSAPSTSTTVGRASRWGSIRTARVGIPLNGYVMRIYRGTQPGPLTTGDPYSLTVLKLMLLGLVYAIPIFVLYAMIYGSIFMAALSGNSANMDSAEIAGWTPNIGLMLLMFLVEIAVALIVTVASIILARNEQLFEAFNVSAILKNIGKIGWINYIIALILITLVIAIPIVILVLGFILLGLSWLYLRSALSQFWGLSSHWPP